MSGPNRISWRNQNELYMHPLCWLCTAIKLPFLSGKWCFATAAGGIFHQPSTPWPNLGEKPVFQHEELSAPGAGWELRESEMCTHTVKQGHSLAPHLGLAASRAQTCVRHCLWHHPSGGAAGRGNTALAPSPCCASPGNCRTQLRKLFPP